MKPIWFVLAWFFFALGIFGAFLPILPTTPFLLLSAFLFSKSSPRFHDWLLNLPVAGEGIRDWKHSKVIRPRAKVLCGTMIVVSLVMLHRNPNILIPVKILVTLILVSVGAFVLTRKNRA